MNIHPETLKVVSYPETVGLRISMEHHKWQRLDRLEEIMVADKVVKLAKMIDDSMNQIQADAIQSLIPKCKYSQQHKVNIITESMIRYHAERAKAGEV